MAVVLGARVAVIAWRVDIGAVLRVGWVLTEVGLRIAEVQGRRVTVLAVRVRCAALGITGDRWFTGCAVRVANIDRANVTVFTV